jgi:hypothetical protein
MARAPLSDVYLTSRLRGRINTLGTCYVYQPGTTTEASVYIDSSSATTITQPLSFNVSRDALPGWVEVGEYDLAAGGKTQPVEVTAGDTAANVPSAVDSWGDSSLGAFNFPFRDINTVAVASTDGTAMFVRLVPRQKTTAAKVVVRSGSTAAGTITKTVCGLYTTDGTTLTRVAASTTNLTSSFLDSTNTRYAQALTAATNIVYPGTVYYVGLLVDATTAPTYQGWAKTANVVDPTAADAPPFMYTIAGQTDLDATEAISGLTAVYTGIPHVGLIP